MKRMIKTALCRLLQVKNLDLLSARNRLDSSPICLPTVAHGRFMSGDSRPRHVELSGVFSVDDCPGPPSDWLMNLAESVIHIARNINLRRLDERRVPPLVHLWPGEHYRLLAAIVRHLQPITVIEVGTFTGLSALAILQELPDDGKLISFDIVPWNEINKTYLRDSDFADRRLLQIAGDLNDFPPYAHLFRQADLIVIDGPKDGSFEAHLLANLRNIALRPQALLVLDDIRLWNMLQIWRAVPQPKLDITSFGHWSGTGLIEPS